MRKSLIGAGAAVASVSLVAVALAQAPVPPKVTVTAKISPSKAGTKAKPRAATADILITNNKESKTTLDTLVAWLPKDLKVSTRGLGRCRKSVLETEGAEGCPSGSRAGAGTAHATLDPSGQATPLTFKITMFVGGPTTLLIALEESSLPALRPVLEGKLSRASGKYGYRLTVELPPELQQPVTGTFAALDDIRVKFSLKRGSNTLIAFTGCPRSGRHAFKVDMTYVPNPAPPAASRASATGTTRCSRA
jgi:hypothetical protein